MEHLYPKDILRYINNKLTDPEAAKVEIHLADCSECGKRVHDYSRIRNNFDSVWDSLTAENYAQALSSAPARWSALREQAQTWVTNLLQDKKNVRGSAAAAALKAAGCFQETLWKISDVLLQMPLAPVAACAPVRGPGDGELETFLLDSEKPGAGIVLSITSEKIDILLNSGVVATDFSQQKTVTVRFRKSRNFSITYDAPECKLTVLSDIDDEIELFRIGKVGGLKKRSYHPQETDYRITEFAGIKAGGYMLAVSRNG